ncbi:MAG TPA: hypothetical protein VKB38_18590 [Terracidiphilus sp.]|nr:hypothetical protein [Terracidiphilus sp.]
MALHTPILAASVLSLCAVVLHATGPEVKETREAVVRPCSNREWQLAFTEEARKLTQGDLKEFGGFNSCESVVLPFLHDATILRLHTPINVDYSIVAVLFRPDHESSLRHLAHCRGMCAHESPDQPESIDAINYVLSRATIKPDREVMRMIVALDLFLLDAETESPFGASIAMKEHPLGGDAFRSEVKLENSSAEVFVKRWGWRFHFSVAGGRVQLVNVRLDSR